MKATLTFTDKPDGDVDVVLEFQPGAFDLQSEAHKFAAKALYRLREFTREQDIITEPTHGQQT